MGKIHNEINSISEKLANERSFLLKSHNIDIYSYSNLNFIPYLLESKIKKKISSYLSDGHIHECPNHKKISKVNINKVYSLIEKLERLNNTELKLLFEKLQEKGPDWAIDYLIGGIRKSHHLCIQEPRDGHEIRQDNFDCFIKGKHMF